MYIWHTLTVLTGSYSQINSFVNLKKQLIQMSQSSVNYMIHDCSPKVQIH
jgi:hypothetical protein